MKRLLLVSLTVAGLALGVWHLRLALDAIFVFRRGEALTSWITMLAGPLSTLPAVVLTLVKRKLGGYWLLAGAAISFTIFILAERGLTENTVPFLSMMAGPMAIIGAGMVLLSRDAIGLATVRQRRGSQEP